MSDLLPQLIVLALGGHDRATLATHHHLVLGFAKVWDSRRPLPNAAALGLGYFAVLRGYG
jgi:hypothetical protein